MADLGAAVPLRAVFEKVMRTIEEEKGVSLESLACLHFLFDKVFEKAVDIVQNSGVKRVVCENSGREIFQVKAKRQAKRRASGNKERRHSLDGAGKEGAVGRDEYLVFPFHYCSCHAFQYEVINKGEMFLCKHILAARLAKALGLTVTIIVSDTLLAQVLLSY